MRKQRLLILSCSKRKRSDPGLLPAIERYDGPVFRILRRFFQEEPVEEINVQIISAEFGLISRDFPIPNYDREITPSRACELRPQVAVELKQIFEIQPYQQVFISVGRDYLEALTDVLPLLATGTSLKISNGPLGKKMSELHDWLYGKPPMLRCSPKEKARTSRPRIRGIEVSLTSEQILEVARDSLAEGWGNPGSYESWYVDINGQRVAPKWLVSRLAGLPVSEFTTDEARRLLERLGVEVRRT